MTKGMQATYTVSYNSENHWSVITQMRGSTWPKVLPYCVINVFSVLVLTFIDEEYRQRVRIEISNQGHTFVTLVVAFLIVSRVNMALARYSTARNHVESMYKQTRELVQNACVFSSGSEKATGWRHELSYRAMLLLRTAMAVIDYPTTKVPAWQVPELDGFERDDVVKAILSEGGNQRWAHEPRSEHEESMRIPIRVAYLLRKTIHSQTKVLTDSPIPVALENKLLGSVDGFMGAYYGIRLFLTTPVPFPLIQMARTFLFLYVFTIPFVLIGDSDSSWVAHCFQVFVVTFGFVGLELVAIEMDNPFGDDENDFNNLALAKVAFEDTYMTILDADGPEAADKLRVRMHDGETETIAHEQSWLLGFIPV